MDSLHSPQADNGPRVRWDWTRIFLLLAASFTTTVGFDFYGYEFFKLGGIQYLELIYLFQIVLIILLFPRHKFQTRLLRPAFNLGVLYFCFLLAAFVLSLVALRNDFYLPSQLPFLKHPIWITLSRMAEPLH